MCRGPCRPSGHQGEREFLRVLSADRNAFNPNVTQANGAAKSRLDALFGGDTEVEPADEWPENNVPKRSALDDLFDD